MFSNTQEIFARANNNHEWEFYLINHQEKAYCKVPKEYNDFCMKIHCSFENDLLGLYIDNKVKGYDFLDFIDM